MSERGMIALSFSFETGRSVLENSQQNGTSRWSNEICSGQSFFLWVIIYPLWRFLLLLWINVFYRWNWCRLPCIEEIIGIDMNTEIIWVSCLFAKRLYPVFRFWDVYIFKFNISLISVVYFWGQVILDVIATIKLKMFYFYSLIFTTFPKLPRPLIF